jgi:hypothetical protein
VAAKIFQEQVQALLSQGPLGSLKDFIEATQGTRESKRISGEREDPGMPRWHLKPVHVGGRGTTS